MNDDQLVVVGELPGDEAAGEVGPEGAAAVGEADVHAVDRRVGRADGVLALLDDRPAPGVAAGAGVGAAGTVVEVEQRLADRGSS